MNTKRSVLGISSIYVFYFVVLYFISATCDGSNWCDVREDDISGLILFSFAPLAILFLLSLITYKMRDEVFRAWWRFARWWVPVIIAVTLFLENAGGGGGGIGISGAVSSAFDILVLGVFYAVLVIVSIVQISRAYIRMR